MQSRILDEIWLYIAKKQSIECVSAAAEAENVMGMFEVKVELANPGSPQRTREVSLLVDTGATLSWIPRGVLESVGVTPLSRPPFTLADGRELERDVTSVMLAVNGRKAPVPVAFGEPGEEAVLGVTALEILGLVVDPVGQKLIPRNLLLLPSVTPRQVLFRRCPEFIPEAQATETRVFSDSAMKKLLICDRDFFPQV